MSENHNDKIMQQNSQNNNHDYNVDNVQNLYKSQYDQQQQLASLAENAPKLNSPVDMAVNKKAITFIILAGLGITALGIFVYHQLSDQGEVQQPVRAEVVSVPELPPPDPYQFDETKQEVISVTDEQKSDQDSKSSHNSNMLDLTANDKAITPTTSQPPVQITQHTPASANISSQLQGDGIVNENKEPFIQGGGELENTTPVQIRAARYMHNKDKLLVQGTYLRCILETKIVSEVSGFTSCIITEPIYSSSGKYLLLPKGSKVLGQYGSSNPTGGRLGVVWDRIITPDGVDVTLKSPGVDNLGAAGHVGKFKSHWPSRLGSALLISMISDTFQYAASEYGPEGKTVTTSTSTVKNPYESESAETLKRLAIQQLDRNNAKPNTVTINQGSLINIYAAQDIDFSSVIQ